MIVLTPFLMAYYAAAAWYLAYVMVNLSGPFAIFKRLREWRGGRWHGRVVSPEITVTNNANTSYETIETKGGEVIHKGLLDCIICTVVWAALLVRFVPPNPITDAFAIAGVALWIMGITTWRSTF